MINDTIDEALPKVVKQLSETLQKSQSIFVSQSLSGTKPRQDITLSESSERRLEFDCRVSLNRPIIQTAVDYNMMRIR